MSFTVFVMTTLHRHAGSVCGLHKAGGGGVAPGMLLDVIDLARTTALHLATALDAALPRDDGHKNGSFLS